MALLSQLHLWDSHLYMSVMGAKPLPSEMEKHFEFLPMRTAHAITQCRFAFHFAEQLSDEIFSQLINLHDQLSIQFPNSDPIQGFKFDMDGVSTVPFGTEYRKVDGETLQWLLHVTKDSISLACFDYKRWAIIFDEVRNILLPVFNALKEGSAQFKELRLNVVDQFIAEIRPERTIDIDGVLRRDSPYIAPIAFSSGALWHSNCGWFDRSAVEGRNYLNNLNITCVESPAGDGVPSTVLSIDHGIVLRDASLQGSVAACMTFQVDDGATAPIFLEMHKINKRVIGRVLVDNMKAKIALGVDNE